MSVFTHAQMYRPLFEEPTPALEREDPFDGPLRFMVGGMANLNFEYLGQQYFDAASLLAKVVQSKDYEDCRAAGASSVPWLGSVAIAASPKTLRYWSPQQKHGS
jgi:hypothetical protein